MLRYLLAAFLCIATPAAAWWQSVQQNSIASAAVPLYFKVNTYAGTTATNNINAALDLTAGTDLVWIRDLASNDHALFNTVNAATKYLRSNTTTTQTTNATTLTAFTGTGFTLGTDTSTFVNLLTHNYVSWTWKAQTDFFAAISWTGDGTSSQIISHTLGGQPGWMTFKEHNTVDWVTYPRFNGTGVTTSYKTLAWNTTGANTGNAGWNGCLDSTQIDVGSGCFGLNSNGVVYTAYFFGHNTAADSTSYCDTFTTNGSGNATITGLPFQPQFLIMRIADSGSTGNWMMLDTIRGWGVGNDSLIEVNTNNAASASTDYGAPTSDGFTVTGLVASKLYVYLAVKAP